MIYFVFSFPGSSCETLLQKFNSVHKDNKFYEMPQRKENAFIVRHYAGIVKYQVIQINYFKKLIIEVFIKIIFDKFKTLTTHEI